MIIASACLCGINCKYNGKNNLNNAIAELFYQGMIIPICPEQLGGLTTPREIKEISGGTGADVLQGTAKVLSPCNSDTTEQFIRGANESLNIALNANIQVAVLKSKSPSCGFGKIYDGSFSHKLIDGNGVTAELLLRNGIKVYNENEDYKSAL